jgi:hypothetical protein
MNIWITQPLQWKFVRKIFSLIDNFNVHGLWSCHGVECDVGVDGNHFGMEYKFYSKIEGNFFFETK